MQKVLRKNLLARNHKVKVARRAQIKKSRVEWQEYDKGMQALASASRQAIKDERKARREDWIQGPLAPNRDTGLNKGIYGTVSPLLAKFPNLPVTERFREKERLFAVGDKVVVVRGRAKGQIGKIKEISLISGDLTIDGVNTADVPVPEWTPGAKERSEKFVSAELPIPLSDVRLVIGKKDPTTKTIEDVVIRHMYCGGPYTERPHGSTLPTHTRYIAGTKDAIGWPEDELREFQAEPADTLRRDVEDITFVPKILDPMLPAGVEDELRSKYKRGRERHSYEWMKEQLMKDAKELWEEERKANTPQVLHKEKEAKEIRQNRRRKSVEELEERRKVARPEERAQNISRKRSNVDVKYLEHALTNIRLGKVRYSKHVMSLETENIVRAEMELAKARKHQLALAQ